MTVLERLFKKGLKFKYLYFFYRLLFLKIHYGGRVHLDAFSVSLERGSRVYVSAASHISFGEWVYIKRGVDIEAHDGALIRLGNNLFINKNSSIIAREGIEIGSNCMIADHVSIYDHNYIYEKKDIPFKMQGYKSKKIRIGNNVWIGSKAFIGSGVKIGDNVVIGANSIVTKDIPSNTIAHSKVTLALRELGE